MAKFYFTFGSSNMFPYQNGFLIVEANNLYDAIVCFKNNYPNRPGSDVLNCSDYYTESQWNQVLADGFYKGELPKAVLSANKNSVFLLIASDGYSIDYTKYNSKEEAAVAMKEAYKQLEPDEILDDYIDSCYCGEDSACLYCNGEDVYVWDIAEISVNLEKEKESVKEEIFLFNTEDIDPELLGEAVYEETTSAFSGTLEDIGNDLLNLIQYDCKTQRDFDLVNSVVIAITGSSLKTLVQQAKEKEDNERYM